MIVEGDDTSFSASSSSSDSPSTREEYKKIDLYDMLYSADSSRANVSSRFLDTPTPLIAPTSANTSYNRKKTAPLNKSTARKEILSERDGPPQKIIILQSIFQERPGTVFFDYLPICDVAPRNRKRTDGCYDISSPGHGPPVAPAHANMGIPTANARAGATTCPV